MRRVQACLNGGRSRAEHPAVPITAAELASAARACVEAGAEAVHLHPRAPDGGESLLAGDVGAAVGAVHRSCPRIPVGVSTGLWITGGDVWRRQAQVGAWADLPAVQRPDFASVNLSEPGAPALVGLLAEAGIGVEAGVWSVQDAEALVLDGPAGRQPWLRVLVEILEPSAGTPGSASSDGFAGSVGFGGSGGSSTRADGAIERADEVLAAVRGAGVDCPVLLHGEREACWPVLRHAGRLGLATRIGLEDVTLGPAGEPVRDNAHLVELARRELLAAAD